MGYHFERKSLAAPERASKTPSSFSFKTKIFKKKETRRGIIFRRFLFISVHNELFDTKILNFLLFFFSSLGCVCAGCPGIFFFLRSPVGWFAYGCVAESFESKQQYQRHGVQRSAVVLPAARSAFHLTVRPNSYLLSSGCRWRQSQQQQ